MPSQRSIPVIVGVGEVKNTSRDPQNATEPMQLMLDAIRVAAQDTKIPSADLPTFLASIDCINVVHTWTWPYADLPGLLASKLNADPIHKHYSEIGGDKPVKLMDDALRKIVYGRAELAIVTGGEALLSLACHMAAKDTSPPWWTDAGEGATARTAADYQFPPGINADHSIGFPIQVYPLYENAFRHARSQSLRDNHDESAQLYADFAKVAERVPMAWNYGTPAPSVKDIKTISKKNRMICFPYPLLMNAFNTVNMAAACILTSTEKATALGIPENCWVYPLGAAGTSESGNLWERPNYFESASVTRSIDTALKTSGLEASDIDLVDIYSCFPIVPKLAAKRLGLPITNPSQPLTVLGGLTSFGGAGNNYSLHAVAEITRLLRQGKGRTGLVLANGGVLTYHHAICLSTRPPMIGHVFPEENPLAPIVDDLPIPQVDLSPEGEAVVETYTVDFDRSGQPQLGHVIGRLKKTNHRFVANHGDTHTLNELASWTKEPIGRSGLVAQGPDRNNLFKFDQASHL